MAIPQITKAVRFDFKAPAYMPVTYHCGRADKGEALLVYWNQTVQRQELSNGFDERHKGAILEYMQSEPDVSDGTAEVLSQYY